MAELPVSAHMHEAGIVKKLGKGQENLKDRIRWERIQLRGTDSLSGCLFCRTKQAFRTEAGVSYCTGRDTVFFAVGFKEIPINFNELDIIFMG